MLLTLVGGVKPLGIFGGISMIFMFVAPISVTNLLKNVRLAEYWGGKYMDFGATSIAHL